MKILEVRDGFIKFEADKNTCLSSFVQIDGIDKSYVAQVIQLKRAGENSIAYGKILFLYDGELVAYDKTTPSKEAQIKPFTFDILNNSIITQNPVIAGKTAGENINIKIDASAFDKKMLVSVDDKASNNLIIRNLTKQFNNLGRKVVIIDTLGVIEAKKYTAGADFKLPLNKASLVFMYQDCLNDVTSESKSLIMEIFKELAEYSETVPFVPFETLKTIVDDMVDNSHVFKLLVLKNKLAKFHRLGYFASNKNQIDRLGDILDSECVILDLSKLDSAFQNKYLEFIYEALRAHSETQVFLELSNVVSKKSIRDVLSDNAVATTIVTHSKFKYLNDIKNVFDNFIIVPSFTNNAAFNIYSTFLNSMGKDTYLLAGEAANYIPLVSMLTPINDIVELVNDKTPEIEESETIQEFEPESEEPDNTESDEELEAAFNEEEIVTEEPAVSDDLSATDSAVSTEEILAGIEEKSDDIITKAINETDVLPPENMFGEAEEETSDKNLNDTIPNEEDRSQEPENQAVVLLTEEDLESKEEMNPEERPLSESFETEVHPVIEISEYNPQENILEDYEEIPITEELESAVEADTLDDETGLKLEEDGAIELVKPANELETAEIEEEIEVPDGIDIIDEPELIPEEPEIGLTEIGDNPADELEVLPISSDDEFDEIVELDPMEADENDIVIDMNEGEEEAELSVDEQIVKDVDKVFTTRKDDEITDSDLDLIDELNSDTTDFLEEVEDSDSTLDTFSEEDNDGIIEELQEEKVETEAANDSSEILETRSSSTPIVPVYNADIPREDMVMSDAITQGDVVTHAKYGTGVVEKMIKYGNKTLFSINFDNIGRRLLDPTLTEIKKA